MEADEGHSSDEAHPPSCLAPNANDGQDASPLCWLKGLADRFSYYTSCVLSSPQRMSPVFVLSRYSCVHEAFVDQGIPVRFAEQSTCIKRR